MLLATKNTLKQMQVYTVFIQGISTSLTGQLPTFHVFKKNTHCAGVRILSILPSRLTRMKMLSLKFR